MKTARLLPLVLAGVLPSSLSVFTSPASSAATKSIFSALFLELDSIATARAPVKAALASAWPTFRAVLQVSTAVPLVCYGVSCIKVFLVA